MQQNFAAVDHTLAHLHEVKVPAAGRPRRPRTPPIVSDEAPDFVKRVTAADDGRQGRPAAGLAPSRWTAPGRLGTTQWEKRNIAAEIPVWDPSSASSATSARWSARTPPSAPRSTSPTELGGRAGDLPVHRLQGPRSSRAGSTRSRWRRRTAPAATCASRSARPRTRRNPRHKAINMAAAAAPLRERGASENYDFFLDAARRRPRRS